jgi:hypothetical protein
MKRYEHLRSKAIKFRNRRFSLGEICERLHVSKTTAYYWIKDIPFRSQRKISSACLTAAVAALRKKYQVLRDAAYQEGVQEAKDLFRNPGFRDFVVAYMCEGYKKTRNQVSIANSDAAIIKLSYYWIKKLTKRKSEFLIQYHVDQDLVKIKNYWSKILNINGSDIKFHRKSNSGKLSGRNWGSEFGVLTIRVNDTYFKSRIDAWIDCVKEFWNNGV